MSNPYREYRDNTIYPTPQPLTYQSLAAALTAEKQLMVTTLEVIASGNTDPDAMVELARATLAKVNGYAS